MMFLQLADGVDDQTWNYHLNKGDYSQWFRNLLKEEDLARATAGIEQQENLPADLSPARIRELVQTRYTAPA